MRYRISFRRLPISQYFILFFILLAFSLVLIPKVSARLLPARRKYLWQNFFNKITKEEEIDGQLFWQFREFYSPGYFIFNRTKNPFLIYKSPLIYSREQLVTDDQLISFYKKNELLSKKLVLKKKNLLIYYQDNQTVKFIFIKPEKEMEKAVGFFDYKEKDKELLKGKNWLVEAYIKIR